MLPVISRSPSLSSCILNRCDFLILQVFAAEFAFSDVENFAISLLETPVFEKVCYFYIHLKKIIYLMKHNTNQECYEDV